MQTGYCLILSLDELRALSSATQQELAMLDADFANMMGIATPANPPAEPKAKRSRAKKGTEQTVLPETGQINQQTAIDPNLMLPGVPQPNMGAPQMPQVPSGMPLVSGIPGMPQQPGPVYAPMPLPTMQTPQASAAMAQQFNGMVPPPPQPLPPVQPQPQPQQQAASNMPTAQMIRSNLIPQIVAQIPDSHGKIAAAVTEARNHGVLPTGDISGLTDAGVPTFLQCLRNQGLISG